MRKLGLALLLAAGFQAATAQAGQVGATEWFIPAPNTWGKNNLHLIDQDPATGFAIYRTSKPDADDMKAFCKLGITEMMVLSGNAKKHEQKYQKHCPGLRVVYNYKQSTHDPLDQAFLRMFDDWVANAHRNGKKIAFRCDCGCHRTGRLAAYYQMKHQGLSLEDAKAVMTDHGKWMIFYPQIYKQVTALHDFVVGRACSTKLKYCVRD